MRLKKVKNGGWVLCFLHLDVFLGVRWLYKPNV